MPTYTCTTSQGLLNTVQKGDIAAAVTTAHAQITGAPAYFAQVIFDEVKEGNAFIGGRPFEHDHMFIEGRIRGGRTAADRETLIRRLVHDVAAVAGVETFSVWVYLLELPSAAMAEFGHILPEPGDEAAWLETLPAGDRDRMRATSG